MSKCLNCGNEIQDAKNCPYCGQPVKQQIVTPVRGKKRIAQVFTCPYCGRQHIGRSKYCPYCGRQMVVKAINPDGKKVYETNNDRPKFKFTKPVRIATYVLVAVIILGIASFFVVENARGNYNPGKLFNNFVVAFNERDSVTLAEALYPKNSEKYNEFLENYVDTTDSPIKQFYSMTNVRVQEGVIFSKVTADVTYKVTENGEVLQNDTFVDVQFFMMKDGGRWYFTAMPDYQGNAQPINFTLGEYYVVHFETNGGTAVADQYVPAEDGKAVVVDASQITLDGQHFIGWYTTSDFTEKYDFDTVVSDNITLYARWLTNATQYTVSFDTNQSGNTVPSQTINIGEKATNVNPQKIADYVFEGWYTDAEFSTKYDFSKEVTADVQLFAKWSKVEYTYVAVDGGYYITGISSANPTEIELPEKYSNKYIIGIGDSAFYNISTLTSVKISKYITHIGQKAFANCVNLKTIEASGNEGLSVEFVGVDAFKNTYWLEQKVAAKEGDANYNNGCVCFGSVLYVCYDVPSNKTIQLPQGITSISDKAFSGLTDLEIVRLRGTVNTIGNSVFAGCTNLREVSMFDSAANIGTDIFSGCTSLETVSLNSNLKVIPQNTFLNCKKLTELILPSSLETISDAAFKGCTRLTKLVAPALATDPITNVIPTTIRTIGAEAFADCSQLNTIYLHAQINAIGAKAFNGCSSITIKCQPASKPASWASTWSGDVAAAKIEWNK